MPHATDVRTTGAALYFLPVETRMPIKFGLATLTQVTCARTRVTVADSAGRTADGWGETPLSVQWVWPSVVPYQEREAALKQFCVDLTGIWASVKSPGHPFELGYDFQETVLPGLLKGFNQLERKGKEPMPWLAALVCCSAFDLALHDAYGILLNQPTYATYRAEFMNRDLGWYLKTAAPSAALFEKRHPADFLRPSRRSSLAAWHLVGGLDPLEAADLTGNEPRDGYPVLLQDW